MWHVVRDDLTECIEHDYQDILIEDVYTSLRTGLATLHVGTRRKAYVGCMVTQVTQDPYSGKQVLHLWLVNGPLQGDAAMPYIEELARGVGARRITFFCDSFTYARLAERWGFSVSRIECMREI